MGKLVTWTRARKCRGGCKRWTKEAVLVQRRRPDGRPGLLVFVCPECATLDVLGGGQDFVIRGLEALGR